VEQQAIYLTIEFDHIKQHSVIKSNIYSKAKSVIEQEQAAR